MPQPNRRTSSRWTWRLAPTSSRRRERVFDSGPSRSLTEGSRISSNIQVARRTWSRASGSQPSEGPRGQVRNPFWSSDGREVVYYKVMPGQFAMTGGFQPGSEFELTKISGGNFPVFSPAGDRIALGINGPDRILEMVNADGTNRRQLFHRQGASAFSPHGRQTERRSHSRWGCTFRPAGRPKAEVGLINPDGTGFRSLTTDESHNGFPSWSPDGRRIA